MNEDQPMLTEETPQQTETTALVPVADSQAIMAQVMPAQMLNEVKLFEHQQRQAALFVATGWFADVKGTTEKQMIARAFVKIALGASMGCNAAESMAGIDIIQGRPSIGASLRASKMQAAGFRWTIDKHDDSGCWLTIYGPDGRECGKSNYTRADADRNGLLGKDNWKKNPLNMFYARAISNAQRFFAPGALGSVGLDLPSREEAMDMEPAPAALMAPRRKGDAA
jgi:hypothetical protein